MNRNLVEVNMPGNAANADESISLLSAPVNLVDINAYHQLQMVKWCD